MKKQVAWTMLLLLLAGCSVKEGETTEKVPIRLTAGISSVTSRAPVGEGSSFEAALYRWDYRKEQIASGSWMEMVPETEKQGMTVLANGKLEFKSGGQFFYVTDTGGSYYTSFKAVVPVGTQDAEGLGVTFSAEQMNGTQDVMVTDFAHAGATSDPQTANLQFTHKLAQFNFQATKLATSEIQTVTGVTLKSVALARHIALNVAGTIEYTDFESLPLVIREGVNLEEGGTVKLGEPAMIKAGTTELLFDITAVKAGGETLVIPAKATFDEATVAGKSYLITLDFNKGEVPEPLEITATIGAWIQSEGGDATFDDV